MGVVGQRVGLVKEDDFERCTAVGLSSGELFDFGANAFQFPLVGSVHFEQILSEVFSKDIFRQRHGRRGFARAWWTSEEQVWKILVSGIRAEALNNGRLTFDLSDRLWSVFLNPKFAHAVASH